MVEMRHQIKVLILAIVFATSLFSIGLFLGKSIAETKYTTIIDTISEVRNDLLTTEVMFQLFGEGCPSKPNIEEMAVNIFKIGKDLEILEREVGYTDKKVLELKEYYNLLLIRYYLMLERLKERCNMTYDLILYFYSNKEEYRNKCVTQGRYLDILAYEKGKRVKIIAIEGELLNNSAIDLLKKIYNVTTYPTLVINGKKYEGIVDIERLREILG